MKTLILIGLTLLASLNVFAQTNTNQTATTSTTYTRPDAEERFKKYVKKTIGPTAFISPVLSSTFRQFRNSPEEWGGKSTGFARRFGDSVGRNVIKQSITYGMDEALKFDSNYYKSPKKVFKSRLSNAFLSSFTARNERGKRVIGVPTIVGTYSAAIIANEVWMPKRFDYKDGLKSGSLSFVTRIGFNLIREFF